MNVTGYAHGDLDGYRDALEAMRRELLSLRGRILIAHHGDCDGMVGGGLLARWLTDRSGGGVELRFASAAEFRLKDLAYFETASADCDAAVFVEAQAMPPEYARLDAKFLNIDHHPHPPDTPIRRMLNPRSHGIRPNPAISLVMHDLCGDDLPVGAAWLAALGSIVDYCPDPAAHLIEEHSVELERLPELRDAFLSVQYCLPFTTEMARFVSELPEPRELLARRPFSERRLIYQEMIVTATRNAVVGKTLVTAETEAGEFRIASPLANRLQDLYDDRCIVVMERGGDLLRCSVRRRAGGVHLGDSLGAIVSRLGEGDGSGHEAAGSARIPAARKREFLALLEETLG